MEQRQLRNRERVQVRSRKSLLGTQRIHKDFIQGSKHYHPRNSQATDMEGRGKAVFCVQKATTVFLFPMRGKCLSDDLH